MYQEIFVYFSRVSVVEEVISFQAQACSPCSCSPKSMNTSSIKKPELPNLSPSDCEDRFHSGIVPRSGIPFFRSVAVNV